MPGLSHIDPKEGPAVLLGRYQLLELIGEGGMGVVWRCFDLDLEEPVAVKFLRDEYAQDETLRACFRREVKLSRRVTHPNVARVFEFGRDSDAYFLTMEFIAGESLHALLDRGGPLKPERLVGLAASLCRGLAAAHDAGVVHGDIKPSNILVEPTRGAVLTDFGIARAISESHSHDDTSSGTPLYMSPERLLGAASTLADDIYAVGVVLFESLTGRVPWPTLDTAGLIEHKCHGGELDLRRLAPSMPTPWKRLISDCLHSECERRPAHAHALLERLASMQHSEPVTVTSQAPAPLATGDGAMWIEVLPFVDAVSNPEWVTDDLVDALTRVRGLRVVTSGASADPSLPPLTRIRGDVRQTAVGVLVSVQVMDSDTDTPRASLELHQPRTAMHHLGADLAAQIVAALGPGLSLGTAPRSTELDAETAALYMKAREADAALRPSVALQLYEAALVRAPGHALLRLGRTMARLFELFLGREVSPEELLEARTLAEGLITEHPDLGDAHMAMAGVLFVRNEPVGCARSLRVALDRAPSLVSAHGMVADLLLDIGRLPDAERRLDIAAALDWNSVQVWTYRARLLACQERWDEYYAVLEGRLAELRFRSAAALRMTLWHPDEAALVRLEAALADNRDGLPPSVLQDARDVVAFALGRGDRRAILERFAAAHPRAGRSRFSRIFAQLQCDMACMIGDLEQARACLAVADAQTLVDWHWIEHSPTLAPLRGDPLFAEIRERVRARADTVAEAIWDWSAPPC